jgi:hypothetical protein
MKIYVESGCFCANLSGFPRLHPRLVIRHWLEGDDVAYWPTSADLRGVPKWSAI